MAAKAKSLFTGLLADPIGSDDALCLERLNRLGVQTQQGAENFMVVRPELWWGHVVLNRRV